MRSQITQNALALLTAGNATVTLQSRKTGNRFTYKIVQAKDTAGHHTLEPRFFVSLLSGPDNENDFRYIGMIIRGGFTVTKGSKVTPDAPSFRAFSWAWNQLTRGANPDTLEIWHEGKCCRCGRTLTVPESISLGIGPECATRL